MKLGKRYFDRAAQRPVDPVPGIVQVRVIGAPADVDAALALLDASGCWEALIHTPAPNPDHAPGEKVIGLLAVRPADVVTSVPSPLPS